MANAKISNIHTFFQRKEDLQKQVILTVQSFVREMRFLVAYYGTQQQAAQSPEFLTLSNRFSTLMTKLQAEMILLYRSEASANNPFAVMRHR